MSKTSRIASAAIATPLLLAASVCTPPAVAASTIIKTIAQLQNINKKMAGDYRLGNDIDAGATKGWNGGAGFIPLGTNTASPNSPTPFTGTFDGAGHKISNLTINSSETTVYTALFAYVGTKGVVENVSLVNADIASQYNGYLNYQPLTGDIAALVAYNSGHVANAAADGKVSLAGYQNIVAGLVGVSQGSIANSSSDVNVTGTALNTEFNIFIAAGLVGANVVAGKAQGAVTSSSEGGEVIGNIATNAGPGYTGGLVGWNYGGAIDHSHSSGRVNCLGCWVGGLVGYNSNGALTEASYSAASVDSGISGRIGGLVGGNDQGATISRSHATGAAASGGTNAAVGGLLGWNYGTVTLSWASGNVSGVKGSLSSADIGNFGGLVGYNNETGLIEKSYATGKVSDDISGPAGGIDLGGLVGANFGGPKGGRILECYATGDVTGTGFETVVGGLVGLNSFSHANGSVQNSFAAGAVKGGEMSPVGAVIGDSDVGNATSVYGIGLVTGGRRAFLGGVIGANQDQNHNADDYWDINTTGRPKGAGRGSQTGFQGLSDAMLKSGNLPTGFSPSIWQAKAGSYPWLRALPQP